MSSTIPSQLEGSQSPNSIEVLWERHRAKVKAFFWILAVAIAGFYGWQYFQQKQNDAKWSAFAQAALLDEVYVPEETSLQLGNVQQMVHRYEVALAETPSETIEQRLAAATPAQRPYLLWTLANRAVRARQWERAKSTLATLRANFPEHPLCVESEFPVQVRPPKPDANDEEDQPDPNRNPSHDELFQPPVAGSAVSRLLAEIEAAQQFEKPTSWTPPEIPADAPRYKVTLSGGYGEFTIALLPEVAPKHCEVFAKLAEDSYWKGIMIDEIHRPGSSPQMWYQPTGRQFHFGFESTRDELDRTKWDASKPSDEEYVVEEFTDLSHFPGAVAARAAQGKSEVNRLWICADDRADQDGFRQVFGYVVEGLETVRSVCEVDFARSEDEQFGRGKPAENISIDSVVKVEQ